MRRGDLPECREKTGNGLHEAIVIGRPLVCNDNRFC